MGCSGPVSFGVLRQVGRRSILHSQERNLHPDLSCWQPTEINLCLPPHSQPAVVLGQGICGFLAKFAKEVEAVIELTLT